MWRSIQILDSFNFYPPTPISSTCLELFSSLKHNFNLYATHDRRPKQMTTRFHWFQWLQNRTPEPQLSFTKRLDQKFVNLINFLLNPSKCNLNVVCMKIYNKYEWNIPLLLDISIAKSYWRLLHFHYEPKTIEDNHAIKTGMYVFSIYKNMAQLMNKFETIQIL